MEDAQDYDPIDQLAWDGGNLYIKKPTMKTTTHTEQDVEACVHFIREYHRLEKSNYTTFSEFLSDSIFMPHKEIYLFNQWRACKRDFGALWFKMDVINRVKMYKSLGIDDPAADEWMNKATDDQKYALYVSPSKTYNRLNNLIIFFNNHGITSNPTDWLVIHDPPISNGVFGDEKDPAFGNSRNWAKFILGLNLIEQDRIVETILNNYQLEHYT